MTKDEKVKSLCNWCNSHTCYPTHCRIYDLCQQYPFSTAWTNLPDEDIDKIFEALWKEDVERTEKGDQKVMEERRESTEMTREEVAEKVMKDLIGTNNPREAATRILFGTYSSSSSDQKAKADYGKEELTLVPRRIIHDICAIRMYGNKKYPEGGPDNWKQVAIERYRNATFRHFLAYLDDPQGKDKESGFPHLWHLACNIAFLCEMEDKV